VVAGPASALSAFAAQGLERGVEVLEIGEAGGELIEVCAAETDMSVPLADAELAWRSLQPA
jgi:hypothetical protein